MLTEVLIAVVEGPTPSATLMFAGLRGTTLHYAQSLQFHSIHVFISDIGA